MYSLKKIKKAIADTLMLHTFKDEKEAMAYANFCLGILEKIKASKKI